MPSPFVVGTGDGAGDGCGLGSAVGYGLGAALGRGLGAFAAITASMMTTTRQRGSAALAFHPGIIV